MADIIDVAAYVLERCGSMTTMKLQKIVFYAQAAYLARNGTPLFPQDFQAWRGGPVCPELYMQHRGKMIIRPGELPVLKPGNWLTGSQRDTIDAVCTVFHDMSGNELSNKTHQERPWKDARGDLGPAASSNVIIPKTSIRAYYSQHPIL